MLPHSLFRNYDIRGEYGTELTPESGYAIARGYAQFSGVQRIVLGYDARTSSVALSNVVIQGLRDSGVDVVSIGMVSTDVLYFATWHGEYDGGIMVTASHMPKQFNGLKFLRLNDTGVLTPIGRGLGMEELEQASNASAAALKKNQGTLASADIWDDFVAFARSFVDVSSLCPLHAVMDAGNGMGGVVAEKLYAGLPIRMTKLFFEPDGTFPNHDPNPSIPENRRDIVAKVNDVHPDLGVAWDADCDRCYFIDEKGEFVNGDFITALFAIHFLKKNPGAHIVYDVRSSWAVPEWIKNMGGVAHKERVGHTYIKARMRKEHAVFGGEISGHYYFADNAYMDSGLIASIIMMGILSQEKKTLSELVAGLGPYYVTGELNYDVTDVPAILKKIEEIYAPTCTIDTMDGVSVEADDWRCNVRPSANDPALRLNLEARSKELMEEKLKEVEGLIHG